MTNNEIDKILDTYDENQSTLKSAIEAAGGSGGILRDKDIVDFLKILAKNEISLVATYTGIRVKGDD